MIKIRIERDQRNEIQAYTVTGHAMTAPHGQDVVCAAVSALAQTTILGFYEVLEQKPDYEIAEGRLECRMMDSLDEKQRREAAILLKTMLAGFRNIQQQYPQVIAIEDEEV
ncbi:MAG: ribosomal-processing cysteine protease Prp [Bacillota bacterium]|nr:ribosomal-processing cysteine protease Prp [Bacillota bacterium]MDW7677610.1 ribosomal-processing cysteine protease Prp [Bacillota bacterium]